jgi:hypothetical protein
LGVGGISWVGLSYLQTALQEAIIAHGWLFCLESGAEGKFYVRVKGRTNCYGEDKEAAIALLIAYVACLKGQVEAAIGQGGEG